MRPPGGNFGGHESGAELKDVDATASTSSGAGSISELSVYVLHNFNSNKYDIENMTISSEDGDFRRRKKQKIVHMRVPNHSIR